MFKINKKLIIIIIFAIIILAVTYYIYAKSNDEIILYNNNNLNTEENIIDENTNENKDNNNINNKLEDEENKKIIIHITGSVVNQGIVKLKENSRISDAIEAAGGTREDADLSKTNLAYILEDGMKIYIPSFNDEEDTNVAQEDVVENKNKFSKININKANQEELENIPGIGASTANKIIMYRNEYGKFQSIDEIKNVKGIGNSKFESMKEYICIK